MSELATPVRERSWYRRLGWLGVLVGGVLCYVAVLQVMVSTQNPNFFPSLLLIGSVTVPCAVLLLAWGSGREVLVRPSVLVATAVGGGLIGTLAAGLLEYDAMKALSGLPMLFVGLIEESVKLIVPLLVLLFGVARDPRSGVVVGVASGMGFATLETMGYGFSALLGQGSLAAVDQTLLLRALLAPAGHVAWTGLTCAALWNLAGSARKGRAALLLLAAFVAAVTLHALWDGSDNAIVHIAVVTVSVAMLLILIHRVNRRTRQRHG